VLILLVGPKGSGKSHIGRTLERKLGVVFFHVEPLWMDYYAECKSAGREPAITEGIARVHPRVAAALASGSDVCVETTGASPEILDDLLRIGSAAQRLVARVDAPLELCLRRIAGRDQANQIPLDLETIRKVHALSVAAPLQPDLTLDNIGLAEDDIVSAFAHALAAHRSRRPIATPGIRSLAAGESGSPAAIHAAPRMSRHIGIVCCSAEGAALCYRTICAEGEAFLGPHAHPEVSMHTPSLAEYVRCLDRGDMQGVGDLMLASAHKLARAGADFLICPDNTLHEAFPYVQARSPLPWLHIAEVVAAEATERKYRRVGLMGTAWLVRAPVYPEKLGARGIETVRPGDEDRDTLSRIIMEELVRGVFRKESVARFLSVIQKFKQQSCDAVVLGCTEIPLIVDEENSPLPTLDSTRLLARAALRRAAGGTA
jgi:aspartate racemase